MRIIKFKGKKICSSEWVSGYYYWNDCDNKPYIIIDYHEEYEVEFESIYQFSGLCDNSNNKNEVYEGDIIEQFEWKGEYYIVEFVDCAFYAILRNNNVPERLRTKHIKLDEMYDFQVVGNKYENPELLKGGEIK